MASATALPLALSIAAAAPCQHSATLTRPKHTQGLSLYSPKKLSSPKLLSNRNRVVMMSGSNAQKDQSLAGLTTLALAATMVIPEMAEAVAPGVSPSLKNFLLSIISGGVVLGVIGVAVIGVSNFDPVKRT
eukprot:Gb_07296 [translate_table: standard]